MRILVVNDDGIRAEGIKVLANRMKELGEIVVVSPVVGMSGAGHSLTCNKEIKVEKVEFDQDTDGYAVYGSPRDCVEFAAHYFPEGYFDLIVSGINNGANMANNIACSGTCGAACTGLDYGIPGIAVSLEYSDKGMDYSYSAETALKYAKWFIDQPFKYDFMLNINLPNLPKEEIKGVKVTTHGGLYLYHVNPIFRKEGNFIYYDANLSEISVDPSTDSEGSDTYAVGQGYISISPVTLKMIQDQYIKVIEENL